MLTIFIFLPLLGCIHIVLSSENRAKILSLFYSLIVIIFSCVIWYNFDPNIIGLQYTTTLLVSKMYTLELGLDGLSLVFTILTTFTIPLCVLASWNNIKNDKYFHVILLSFAGFTNLVWMATDLFLFYVSFEAVLVPLFIIIGIYSKGEGKTRAAFLLFLYTFSGSLFMLLSFSVLYYYTGTSSINTLITLDIDSTLQIYCWLGIFLALAIKTPMVPFHNWILRAHVEANVAGSIVLAGLTLKIASYGMLRILLPILPEASIILAPLAITLAVISILYASFAAIRQTDIKCLIAYSSVAHMGIAVLGIFSINYTGILGSVILGLAHGYTSPALFFIVGAVMYDRFHTRVIKCIRGLSVYIPLAITFFFIFTLANMGTPLTANWIGELYSLSGAYLSNPYICLIATTTVFLSACYSIWLYNRIAFGTYSPYLTFTTDLTRREFIILLSLLLPVVLIGIYPSLVSNLLHASLTSIVVT